MGRTFRLLVIAILLGGIAVVGQDHRRELERLETVWNSAHLHGDADALDRLWHEDLVVIAPKMPPMSKSEALAFARSGRMAFQKYETSELSFRTYGTTALVTGLMHRSRTIGGHQVDDAWRFTKVYLHDAVGWRVVSFQASEAPQ